MYKYKAIRVNGIKYDEHRYIMEQVVGRKLSFNECVHHKDGDAKNNELTNLELIDRSSHTKQHMTGLSKTNETISKLVNHGRDFSLKSSKCHGVTLIKDIKKDLVSGVKGKDICKKYSVNKYLVSNIKNGKRWAWLF